LINDRNIPASPDITARLFSMLTIELGGAVSERWLIVDVSLIAVALN
jgi:hypothetical protein